MYYRVTIQRQADHLDRLPSGSGNPRCSVRSRPWFSFYGSIGLFRKIVCGCSPPPHAHAMRNVYDFPSSTLQAE
jgi:hypothetical protein